MSPTLVHDKDLPVGMKQRQKIAHQIAKQSAEQVWDIAIDAHKKIGTQITGNEALSYMSTILQDFAARWIVYMDRIRETDDAGVLREDLVKGVMNGILASIGCSASFEEEAPLPDGIKRLKKEGDNESAE
jgi:hypothetical protein